MDFLVRDTIQLVDLQNQNGFKQIFADLCSDNKRSVAAELATRILAEQETALLQPNPNRERYEFTLKNLKEVFPYIKNYFSKDPQKKDATTEGLNIHAISSKGQRAIIQEMENRNALNGKTVVVSENFPAFKDSIASFFANAKENEDKLFLVRHRKKD